MNAPDNIYINDSAMNDPDDDPWHEARPHKSNDGQARYIRHDLHAAVEAERDELRTAVEKLKEFGRMAGDDMRLMREIIAEREDALIESNMKRNLMQDQIDQLRARLDAACEWQPIAEAELKNSEPVIAWQNGGDWREAIHFHGRFCYPGSDEEIYGMTHVMRIKPPASADSKQ